LGAAVAAALGLKVFMPLSLKLAVLAGIICFIVAALLNYYLYPKSFKKQIKPSSNQAADGTKAE